MGYLIRETSGQKPGEWLMGRALGRRKKTQFSRKGSFWKQGDRPRRWREKGGDAQRRKRGTNTSQGGGKS